MSIHKFEIIFPYIPGSEFANVITYVGLLALIEGFFG